MARRSKKRRNTTTHPGVKLVFREWPVGHRKYPSGGAMWFARWADPVTGKWREKSLDSEDGCSTAEGRVAWAENKSAELELERQAIQAQRQAIKEGRPPTGPTNLAEATEKFLERCRGECRPATVRRYETSVTKFKAWSAGAGLRQVEELTPPGLAAFRDWLGSQPSHKAKKGGPKGAKRPVGKPSPATYNADLAAVRAMLNHWRRLGLLPRCSSDSIRDSLQRFRTKRPRPPFLREPAIRQLLEAALRHDRETFVMTRTEKAEGHAGVTARYQPLAPLVLFSLLGGTRLGEAITLTWDRVHLDAQGGDGEVIVLAERAKTGIERTIVFDVTPSLRELLANLRLAAGGEDPVFGLTDYAAGQGMQRLVRNFGAPKGCTWKNPRATCGTYLSNAPGIYGAASCFHSARRLGHSVAIAERNYLGVVKVPTDARTLEEAMAIEDLAREIVARAGGNAEDDRASTLA